MTHEPIPLAIERRRARPPSERLERHGADASSEEELLALVIGDRVGRLGSELLGSAGLPLASWLILAFLPVAGVLLAMLVARTTILRALGRLL